MRGREAFQGSCWVSCPIEFSKGEGPPARTGVTEDIVKEVRFELAFWEENAPSPVFSPTPPLHRRGVSGELVLVLSFSTAFDLIFIPELGADSTR